MSWAMATLQPGHMNSRSVVKFGGETDQEWQSGSRFHG